MSPKQATEHDRRKPNSVGELFVVFTWLGLQGFGGVLPVVQHELVERKRWLTREEFVEDWAVAQVMPGPNIINMALMIGGRAFGLRGAMAALGGILLLPLLLLLSLELLHARFAHYAGVAGALRGTGAVAAGLFAAVGLRLLGALHANPLGRPLAIALGLCCFAAVALFHWPLLYVLLSLGTFACLLCYRNLKS
ncbi:chromate transporter (plasmid) [Cupriavidus necator]|uniref:Chromate transporter n=1 Tax=Cupriavidus necator TaxID=106590 RepID=A0A1U9V4B6_CUPNE|nr:chromate transporter [Cupriavidus necator]AQV99245.1 chromate transporter [Cupriavidus necator]